MFGNHHVLQRRLAAVGAKLARHFQFAQILFEPVLQTVTPTAATTVFVKKPTQRENEAPLGVVIGVAAAAARTGAFQAGHGAKTKESGRECKRTGQTDEGADADNGGFTVGVHPQKRVQKHAVFPGNPFNFQQTL